MWLLTLNMGWVSLKHSDKINFAKSWNFIHWARNEEMARFLSPSIIIKELSEHKDYGAFIRNHWVILDNTSRVYSKVTSNEFIKLPIKNENHTLNNGLVILSKNELFPQKISVDYISKKNNKTIQKIFLEEILADIHNKKEDTERIKSLFTKYEFFANRIFHNDWDCKAYLRFPVFSDLQLRQGADIFVAYKTDDPKLILNLILQATETLALIASTIDNRMSYKAISLLAEEVRLDIDGLLGHEIGNKIIVVEDLITNGKKSTNTIIKDEALTNSLNMLIILKGQINIINNLSDNIPIDITFDSFIKGINNYATILKQISSEKGGFDFLMNFTGFDQDEKIDDRLTFFCLLLLHNAHIHSQFTNNYPRKVNLIIEKEKILSQTYIHISLESSLSERPPEDIEQDLLNASPINPRRSFEACIAIVKYFNPNNYKNCLHVEGKVIKVDDSLGKNYWQIKIDYKGLYKLKNN